MSEIDNDIRATENSLREFFKARIINGEDLQPMVSLFCRKDPRTGEAFAGGYARLMLVMACRTKEESVHLTRMISIAGEAFACVMAADAWIVVRSKDDPIDPNLAPSTHPERKECVVISTERDDGRVAVEYTAYCRDQGEVLFDAPIREEGTGAFGAMQGIVAARDAPPPPALAEACRIVVSKTPEIQIVPFHATKG